MVWHLARNPRVAMHLMRCNMVPILFQGLAKPDLSDPLPLIGVLLPTLAGRLLLHKMPAAPSHDRTRARWMLCRHADDEEQCLFAAEW